MKLTVFLLIVFIALLIPSCRTDYDIVEAASQHTSEEHDHGTEDIQVCHDCGEPHESDDTSHVHESDEHMPVIQDTDEHDPSAFIGSDRHSHETGSRNHGTEWFFNQPWAARFIWSKMVRDAIILFLLAAAITLVSGYRRKRR